MSLPVLQSCNSAYDLKHCWDSSHWSRQTSAKGYSAPASLIFNTQRDPTNAQLFSSEVTVLPPGESVATLELSGMLILKNSLILRKLLFSSANCFLSAYHGHLTSLIDISPYKFRNLEGQKEWVHVVCTSHYNYQLLVNLMKSYLQYTEYRILFFCTGSCSRHIQRTLQRRP